MRNLIYLIASIVLVTACTYTPTPQQHYKKGVDLWNIRKYAAAIVEFNQALNAKPDYIDALYFRGLAKFMLHYSSAITDFTKVISLKPDYYKAYHFRGLAESNEENYAAAIADQDSCIAIDSSFMEAYFQRGNFKVQIHDYDAAIRDEEKAIALKKDYTGSWYIKGLAETAKGDYTAAIADLDKTISFNNPDYLGKSYYFKARCEQQLNEKDAACQDFKKALDAGYQKAADASEKYCK